MVAFTFRKTITGSGLAAAKSAFLAFFFLFLTWKVASNDSPEFETTRRPSGIIKRQDEPGVSSNDGRMYDVTKPPNGPLPFRTAGDAPWTQAERSYQSMISCPRGIQRKERGIILLIPGTGSNARETYFSSPYYQLLPSEGFDVCWIDTPNYSMSDMQLTAEFIAYGIKYLAPKSVHGRKINIVSWSQGGPNVQWASTFWPSIRRHVRGHISLAPSMKGTLSTILLCPMQALVGGCDPSLLQQTAGSNYMNAANSHEDRESAAYALIPTTIIFSYTDEIVTPQVGDEASSRLIHASNIGIQDICGPTHNIGHFAIMGDVGAYGIALDALLKGRPARSSTIDRSYCSRTASSLGFQTGNLANDLQIAFRIAIGDSRVQMIASEYETLRLPQEPYLQKYVCDRGYTNTRCTRNGFQDKPTSFFSGWSSIANPSGNRG